MTRHDPDADASAALLRFWFEEVGEERHFAKDAALDAECELRFGPLRDALIASEAAGWRDEPPMILAAIILLDQLSRNIYRGSGEAFAADPLALELALIAIAAGFDQALPPDERAFVYMPLMHAEDRGVQRFSVRCFRQPGLEKSLSFATAHRDVIERFERFPGRNAALSRANTPQEEVWLAEGGGEW